MPPWCIQMVVTRGEVRVFRAISSLRYHLWCLLEFIQRVETPSISSESRRFLPGVHEVPDLESYFLLPLHAEDLDLRMLHNISKMDKVPMRFRAPLA